MEKTGQAAIIILAAGSSSRLGTPKQLLHYKGSSLLKHIIDITLQSRADSVYAVLGYQASKIKEEIIDKKVNIIDNPDWQTGISSSIRTGIRALPNSIDAALIILCDQPKITSTLLNTLIDSYKKNLKPVIACRYSGVIGVPALFDKKVFPDLLKLQGDAGAKRVIEQYASQRLEIDFPDGIYDIDSPGDSHSLN